MKHTLPPLPYAYDALEPHIDSRTMEIHHTKHHQAYIDKLNAVLDKHPDLADRPVEELLLNLKSYNLPAPDQTAIRNHGGGHLNHSLFWQIMGPKKQPDKKLASDIKKAFGSVEDFKKQFTDLATTLFGSGWVWLARDDHGTLHMHQLPNQDSPYLHGHTPVIGLDVWEHAYYLKYQNRRAEYIEAWWSVLKLLP
ncbi:MAG: superoxide dismutase [Candidatus Kerfeldbacteria bacterium]|nr:superoxide dismutase [Candidatus Kerfeldbacteria bacterium]